MADETKTIVPETKPATDAANQEHTRPEEKALADKLMEELKASGVDVNALAKEEGGASIPAPPKETSPQPAPDVSPPKETLPVSPPPATPPAAKRRLSLPHLSLPFKKKAESAKSVPETQLASPEAQQITTEALMEMIDERIDKISGDDFITIRISKQALLIVVGLVLVVLWLLSALHLLPSMPNPFSSIKVPGVSQFTTQPTVPPESTVQQESPSIRVRIGTDSVEEIESIKVLLQTAGYASVDIVADSQVNPNQVLVVTRDGAEELRKSLAQVFSDSYNVSTEAATLTADSDFSATILIGKSSRLP